MMATNDEKQLKACLTKILDVVQECVEKFNALNKQRKLQEKNDYLSQNFQSDYNILTFTLNNDENELLKTLTVNIEMTVQEYSKTLSQRWLNNLLDFLHSYHYNGSRKQFVSYLGIDHLYSLNIELKGLLASYDGYPAAYNGQLDIVKRFLDEYPTFKDKSGLWETTLLYSAARNNHLDIVKYLIEEAHCSVNAQNQHDVDFALDTSTTTVAPRAIAGSTALHGACFNNHLNVVKYLVEHGADYFIQNQALETPINNGESHIDIKNFFQDYFIKGYSIAATENLPNRPITNDNRRPFRDSFWEYKPFQDHKWYKFSAGEANLLQQALLPSEPFQQEVYLRVAKGLYRVSTIEFLRSGRYEQDPQKNMAWVRCRGSSILNFDCYAIWQIMLIQHEKVSGNADYTPSLKIQSLPVMFSSIFNLQLHAWYSCDDKTSSILDNAMNYRRKIISIDIPYIGDKLTFNLQTFEFSNNEKKIHGFIRWVPKLISNTEIQNKKLVYVDNYEAMTSIQPIPLTIKCLKEALQMSNIVQQEIYNIENQDNEDDSGLSFASVNRTNEGEVDGGNDDDDDDESNSDGLASFNSTNQLSYRNLTTYRVVDLNEDTTDTNPVRNLAAVSLTNTIIREDSKINLQNNIPDASDDARNSILVEKIQPALKGEVISHLISRLESEAQQLNNLIEKEKLNPGSKLLDELQQQLFYKKHQEEKLKNSTNEIIVIDYDNVESIIANTFLFGKSQFITDHIRTKHPTESSILGIPNLTIQESNDLYRISVAGTQVQHDEFKHALKRVQSLSNAAKSAKISYQKTLNSILEKINYIMTNEIHQSKRWKSYTKCFQQLVKSKIEDFVKVYEDYILQKSKLMVDECITDANLQPLNQLQKLTDTYMKIKRFLPELEILKIEALDEYIKQHILLQELKFVKKPSKASLVTMNNFIDQIKRDLKTNPIYVGCNLEQFKDMSKLLRRIMLYYRCFLLQLPLYESSKDFLEKVEQATVTTIATSNGSGKSTLLPALLIANGYEKVIVTQPRRLLCTTLCRRVNKTMTTNTDEFKLAGWAANGDQYKVNSNILYLTDSLLKERLLYDENFIANIPNNQKPIIFFLDEVHERSSDTDIFLASFARLLKEQPDIKSKLKIIISSATLDSSVSALFHQIPQLKVEEFKMPNLGTLHTVTKIERPNQNILDLVQELCKTRQRYDQLLCFVSSVSDVNQCCRLLEEISHGTLIAYPLIQSQSAADQEKYIEQGSIFFSTTVAETSLTFPSLKYVIDTGMINIPVYDFNKKQTTLMEVRAAESTIKQRLGRLGRTKTGEYYSLYEFKVEDKKYPKPQICQSDLTNIEFSLRKSLIKNGLHYLKQYLPDAPEPQAISTAVEELRRLNILDSKDKLTSIGTEISKLPDFGSLAMSKSVLSALNENNCGRDLIVLSSILSVLNTSSILKAIPSSMKKSEGDFMTLLNVMNEILLLRKSVPAQQFNLAKVCQAKQLTPILHILRQAVRRYVNLEKSFNLVNEYRVKAQISSNDWKSIAKSLLSGYRENVFVSMKELQGKTHLFTRYSPPKEDVAVLDLQSTLTREITSSPVSLILARDIRFSSSVRATAVLSFVGEIKSQWIDYPIQRSIKLNTAEEAKLNSDNILTKAKQTFPNLKIQLNNHILSLDGSVGSVLDAELDILRQLVVEMKLMLANEYPPSAQSDYERMKRNLEGVSKMPAIFNPMKWRWEAQQQVKITVSNNSTNDECEITIEGRDSQNQLVQNEFRSFLGWLKMCAVIRHPNAGVPPRILKPAMRKTCLDIEERISRVTDSKRTPVELWKGLHGSKATRETRMEVVAWIAVCKFDCRVEGGFVRDWIVGHYTARPSGDPSTWLTPGASLPYLDKALIPSDLDCHLPSHKYFDIDKFLDNLHKYQIEYKVFREDWRYVLLLDENTKTGPFTMDLIEPHVALTQDRIDLDVSNLSLEKDYTKELGMRVDITYKPYSFEIETIVDNVKTKRFQVLRPIDKYVQSRIDKMSGRGWTQLGKPMHVIPNPLPQYQAVLVPLPNTTELNKNLVTQLKTFINDKIKVFSIVEIKNPILEETYLAVKQLIANQCKGQNPNERELFFATANDDTDGIFNNGYDERYWRKGKLGHGAYFSENPSVSHKYVESSSNDKPRIMYFNKIILGNELIIEEEKQDSISSQKGYHSIHARIPTKPTEDEYLICRYGQALPYLRITYKT